MNMMAIISLITFFIYLNIGIYAFRLDRKSSLNRLFLLWCLSMAVWSLGYSFVYYLQGKNQIWLECIFMKVSAIGWCSFSSISLHIIMLITENRFIKKVKVLIYIPGIIFFLTTIIFFWPSRVVSKFIENFFYIGNFLYNFSFLLVSIYLTYIWGKKSENIREKKQANIIVVTSIIPFTLNLITQTILPIFKLTFFPLMGHIYSLVMLLGTLYAINKYKLLNISTDRLIDEILSEMMDLFALLSPKGKIIRVSKSTEQLLEYREGELLGKEIGSLVKEIKDIKELKELESLIVNNKNNTAIRYEEFNIITKNGDVIPVSLSCSVITDPYLKDILGIAIIGHDIRMMKKLEQEIKEHKEAEKKLKENQEIFLYLAYHDTLTGLYNRKYFYEQLNAQLKNSKDNNKFFAVFFIDLNGFKKVNDDFGHDFGDFLLCEAGKRIKECVKECDVVARIGGDEFTLIITSINSNEDAFNLENNIHRALNRPINKENMSISIEASIGISIFPEDGDNEDTLINEADRRMYTIKHKRNHYKV
jgi:PAS domain S-box/diguanylate cyclase (GGDEF) domain